MNRTYNFNQDSKMSIEGVARQDDLKAKTPMVMGPGAFGTVNRRQTQMGGATKNQFEFTFENQTRNPVYDQRTANKTEFQNSVHSVANSQISMMIDKDVPKITNAMDRIRERTASKKNDATQKKQRQ